MTSTNTGASCCKSLGLRDFCRLKQRKHAVKLDFGSGCKRTALFTVGPQRSVVWDQLIVGVQMVRKVLMNMVILVSALGARSFLVVASKVSSLIGSIRPIQPATVRRP